MSADRNCPACSRKLLKAVQDKCMYCGADIPVALRLSSEEKQALADKQKKQHEESEQAAKRRREGQRGNGHDTSDFYAENFMGVGDQRIRFVGHGVGTELDEYPFLAKGQQLELQPGMVIALEPKLIFPGKGVVGIENTHIITETGLKQLGKFNEDINVISPQ